MDSLSSDEGETFEVKHDKPYEPFSSIALLNYRMGNKFNDREFWGKSFHGFRTLMIPSSLELGGLSSVLVGMAIAIYAGS